jgi:hypothetical protein
MFVVGFPILQYFIQGIFNLAFKNLGKKSSTITVHSFQRIEMSKGTK